MDFVPMHEFRRCVTRYKGNYKVSTFSCWDQFLCMAFAQLTYRESLRDIETCLRAMQSKLYHLGIRGRVSRSTLADANEKRDWRIYADFTRALIQTARLLYANDGFGVALDHTAYALDATTVDLCLSLFPWAQYREKNAGIKIHTLLDLRGNIPSFLQITPARIHDVNFLDQLVLEPGSFYIMDRGYTDFARLYTVNQCLAYFIIRPRKNFQFQRIASSPVDKTLGLQCDQTIRLVSFYTRKGYPDSLRRIRYTDPETQKRLTFLTNNFLLPTISVPQLYKCRWQVELFFKWIKQHLRIKKFYGISDNAIKTQIWIAAAVYVLVAIVRKRLQLDFNLYSILQILSVTLFEKTSLSQLFSEANLALADPLFQNQLNLFD
jgi:hypothetical protein